MDGFMFRQIRRLRELFRAELALEIFLAQMNGPVLI